MYVSICFEFDKFKKIKKINITKMNYIRGKIGEREREGHRHTRTHARAHTQTHTHTIPN